MPASLTIQVRLGFSMGWRIWTPNEVGFYAKTLAHSYFILVILKAKFLKECIWIVNYNLFMGLKKYYIFVEFLKFGMKSKEERSFWRKVMYISLLLRHPVYTKQRKIYEANQGFRMKVIRRLIMQKFSRYKKLRRWVKLHRKIIKLEIKKNYKLKFKQNVINYASLLKNNKIKVKVGKCPNYFKIKKNTFKFKNFLKILVWLKLLNVKKKVNKQRVGIVFKKFIELKRKKRKKLIKKFKFKFWKKIQKIKKKNLKILNLKKKIAKNTKLLSPKRKPIFKNFFLKKILKKKIAYIQKPLKLKKTSKFFIFLYKKYKLIYKKNFLKILKKTKKLNQLTSNTKHRKLNPIITKLNKSYLKLIGKKINKINFLQKISTKKKKQIFAFKFLNGAVFLKITNKKKFKKLKRLNFYVIRKKILSKQGNMFNIVLKSKVLKKKTNQTYQNFNGLKSFIKKQKIANELNSTVKKFSKLSSLSDMYDVERKARLEAISDFFKMKQKVIPMRYSVFGGPRKRLSRNLRRSYKGKQIKNVLNLVWFWEKISRLMSYYFMVHKLIETKRLDY